MTTIFAIVDFSDENGPLWSGNMFNIKSGMDKAKDFYEGSQDI